jgi:hypothetical protein
MRSSLSATLGPAEPFARPLDGLSVMAISPPLELARESVFLDDDDPKALRAASPSPPARPSDPSSDFGFVP